MTAKYGGPPDRLDAYERLVSSTPGVERKGATMPYTSRNGHMFSFLDATGQVSLRLSPQDREAFTSRYEAEPSIQHGRPMKEYVPVPHDLLDRTDELREWLIRSHAWIETLPPKATTRKK